MDGPYGDHFERALSETSPSTRDGRDDAALSMGERPESDRPAE